MIIKIDNREPAKVFRALSKHCPDNMETEELETGDFHIIINGTIKVVIERKTIPDLWGSITDGRLFNQCHKMSKLAAGRFLLIEGSFDEVYTQKPAMNYAAISSALASVSLFYGVNVLSFNKMSEMGRFIFDLFRKSQKNEVTPPIVRLKPKKVDPRVLVVMGVRGIGEKTAKILIDEFVSVQCLCNAEIEEIMGVKGIGKVTAKKIHTALR